MSRKVQGLQYSTAEALTISIESAYNNNDTSTSVIAVYCETGTSDVNTTNPLPNFHSRNRDCIDGGTGREGKGEGKEKIRGDIRGKSVLTFFFILQFNCREKTINRMSNYNEAVLCDDSVVE